MIDSTFGHHFCFIFSLNCLGFLLIFFSDFFSSCLFYFSFVCPVLLLNFFLWIRDLVTFSSLFLLLSSVDFNSLLIPSTTCVIALTTVANVWIVGDALISDISDFVQSVSILSGSCSCFCCCCCRCCGDGVVFATLVVLGLGWLVCMS